MRQVIVYCPVCENVKLPISGIEIGYTTAASGYYFTWYCRSCGLMRASTISDCNAEMLVGRGASLRTVGSRVMITVTADETTTVPSPTTLSPRTRVLRRTARRPVKTYVPSGTSRTA